MIEKAKIIVLTPVKNEDWILEQFLEVTSLFADCIIIADQQSTDNSRVICSKFPKVHLINNNNDGFCEDARQVLLIETARKIFPQEKRILLGLDSDELISADSLLFKQTWDTIRELEPGTSLYFERSDLLNDKKKCIRGNSHESYYPIGYVDDGNSHKPTMIHSRRVPHNPAGKDMYIDDIKIVHFIFSRMKVSYSKMRYYAVLENVKKTSGFYIRRYAYNPTKLNFNMNRIENTPQEWLAGWENRNINLKVFKEPKFSYQDFEVLKYFKEYGYSKFHVDNIWDFDWEACWYAAHKSGREVPEWPIKKPNKVVSTMLRVIDNLYVLSRRLRFIQSN
ncbi:glycosyltransferase family 2 protein [Arcticibacter eurypsychrophilus]|uniref:glycosyltransferase family 2 protein n=1 Tax=Arcticibacter eurypsychrophilus TaxID=1434752 RepID=UPI00084DD33B|nr:glycosyltransferase family 2 protein [Arcticibacter eurypsychrophilus]